MIIYGPGGFDEARPHGNALMFWDGLSRTFYDYALGTSRPYTEAENAAADDAAAAAATLSDLATRVARIEAHLWPAPPDPTMTKVGAVTVNTRRFTSPPVPPEPLCAPCPVLPPPPPAPPPTTNTSTLPPAANRPGDGVNVPGLPGARGLDAELDIVWHPFLKQSFHCGVEHRPIFRHCHALDLFKRKTLPFHFVNHGGSGGGDDIL